MEVAYLRKVRQGVTPSRPCFPVFFSVSLLSTNYKNLSSLIFFSSKVPVGRASLWPVPFIVLFVHCFSSWRPELPFDRPRLFWLHRVDPTSRTLLLRLRLLLLAVISGLLHYLRQPILIHSPNPPLPTACSFPQ